MPMIDSQSDSEKKQRLESVIDCKLGIVFDLASFRQNPSIINVEIAEKVLQCRACVLSQQLPAKWEIDRVA